MLRLILSPMSPSLLYNVLICTKIKLSTRCLSGCPVTNSHHMFKVSESQSQVASNNDKVDISQSAMSQQLKGLSRSFKRIYDILCLTIYITQVHPAGMSALTDIDLVDKIGKVLTKL